MKNIIYSTCFVILLTSYNHLVAQGSWSQKHYVGYAYNGEPCIVDKTATFSIGTKGYVCTGESFGPVFLSDLWQYDVATHAWSQLAPFPGTLRVNAVAIAIDSFGYLGTGEDTGGVALKDWWQYNPSSNTWTQKSDLTGPARTSATCFSIGTNGYVALGAGDNYSGTCYNDVWEYNSVADTWAQKSNFAGASRFGAVAFTLAGFAYMGTGEDSNSNVYNDIWKYNAVVDTWAYVNTFGGGRYAAESCTINGKGYVAGGLNLQSSVYANDMWEFDATTQNWTYKTDLVGGALIGRSAFSIDTVGYFMGGGNYSILNEYHPSMNLWDFHGRTRYDAVGFSIGNKGYIGGGAQEGFAQLTDLWEYDINSDTWSQKASCNSIGNFGLSSFVLDSNSAYVSVTSGKQLWQYKQNSNTWIRKADYPGSGGYGSFGLAIDSIGYVGGGFDSVSNTTKDFWAYYPTTNTWIRKSDIGGPTRGGSTTFGINHKGYVCMGDTGIISGGYGSNYPSDSSLWEYNPATDSWSKKSNFIGNVRSGAVSFVVNNLAYVGTGYSYDLGYHGIFFSDFYSYNPMQDQWTASTALTGPARADAVGFAIGYNGYVGTGLIGQGCYSSYNLNDFWQFIPSCSSLAQSLCLVSIDTAADKPVVIWEKANKYATDSFYIYRTNTPDSVYNKVAAVGRDSLSIWQDATAYPDRMSYRYKMAALDTCGNISTMSPYHQTMYLTQLGGGTFSWTPYVIEGDTLPFGTYDFYEDSTCHGDWRLLASLPNTQTTAFDSTYRLFPCSRYKVVLTLINPCNPSRGFSAITSNIYTLFPTAISELMPSKLIKVLPNPTFDMLTILCDLNDAKSVNINNILGQSVYLSDMSSNILTINTQDWQNGVYFVTVSSADSKATIRVVKR